MKVTCQWLAFLGLAFWIGTSTQYVPAQKTDIHDPAVAVANLEVHPELQATLFASEPQITNPVNLDIDHRGRVWLCDVKNYRGNNGKRPEGDRILILEDTNSDGKADKITTFYQGRDIDSAMGICVLGNKLIVSATPNVFVFTFDENDKVLKKEVLFTKTGQPQHDHSAHSFLFGPDGRLYWNFGNTGHAVHDKNGKPIIDLAGNVVIDKAQPYRQGMVFRCDMDGSNFEVLGHNFRNNYEVTVDSFGTLWQSDNDDDGNRGVRINYVMEFGNYGYVDEITGAGWQTKRTNMETETPLKHWHLNDPGVVPNLLQTYQGSPTGICIYEGNLLPKALQNQVIHCDAGPSIVRAYPVTVDGAGYKASIINILDGNKKNNWFRPADVCAAPDGSLYVTDWYDPGVGGHQQRDIDRGRIFRVAPPGAKVSVPKFNFETTDGLIEALKNPNLEVRYLAWTKLNKMGAKAEPALQKLFESPSPHERARALWLLGRIEGEGIHYVEKSIADKDDNIRIVGIRLARLLKMDMARIITNGNLAKDPSPAVRRECAIALRHNKSPEAAKLWASLARQHDGKDRWYLEALGIGADKNWTPFLTEYLQGGPTQTLLAKNTRDIIWRSRAEKTPELLAQLIASKDTPAEELPRLFRAFDFQATGEVRDNALVNLAFANHDPARRDIIVTESLARIKNLDVKANPKHAEALKVLLENTKGTPAYVEFISKFNVKDRYPELLALAQKNADQQLGVDAMRVLLDRDLALVKTGIDSTDKDVALKTVQAIGSAGHDKSNGLLLPLVQNIKADLELRRQATRALGKSKTGAQQLIKLAQDGKLGEELKPAAGSVLSQTTFKDIREQAIKLFPIPASKDNKPVPAIPDLVKGKGNATRGLEIFAKVGTCANCHVVNGVGKEVGPNLSEIGKKLSREALFETILYPSASISHNFETYLLETKSGTVAQGLLVSQTPTEVTLKGADALVRTFKKTEVESLNKTAVSLMPADLHKALTTQDLTDVVEYMLTLRELKKAP